MCPIVRRMAAELRYWRMLNPRPEDLANHLTFDQDYDIWSECDDTSSSDASSCPGALRSNSCVTHSL